MMKSKGFFAASLIALALLGARCTQQVGLPAAPAEAPKASDAPNSLGTDKPVPPKTSGAEALVPSQGVPPTEAPISDATKTQPKPAEPKPVATTPAAPAVKTFNITAKQWAFDPASITVKLGDTVKLAVTSKDVGHGLAIRAFGVALDIPAGTTQTAQFVANQKGTFPMFCSVFCGAGHSDMHGTLVVE